MIVWHMSGNLASRFTDFLTTDGEKAWRQREEEFAARMVSKPDCIAKWDAGWKVLFDTLTKGSADSFALRNHGMKAMLPGVFPERAFSTEYALKDLSYAIQMAEEKGVPALGSDVARELMERAVELGHGKEYWPVLLRAIEDATGKG